MPNISQCKGNQTMSIQYNLFNKHNRTREIFFLKNYTENEAGRLVPDLCLFLLKKLR